ncbi:MAG: YheU family protein, partial [Pseudomonadales bacterium]
MASIAIPWDSLSETALRGIVEEFVTREGTEYGARPVSLDEKRRAVLRQLEAGEVLITFNDEDQT